MECERTETMSMTYKMCYGSSPEASFQEVFRNELGITNIEEMVDANSDPFELDFECIQKSDALAITHAIDGFYGMSARASEDHKYVTISVRVREEFKLKFTYGLFLCLKRTHVPIILRAQSKMSDASCEPTIITNELKPMVVS